MPFNFDHIVKTKEYKDSRKSLNDAHRALIEENSCDLGCDSSSCSVLTADGNLEKEETFKGPTFFPLLYIQRYKFVADILTEYGIEKVVDFGSAECKIVTLLKTVPSLTEISLVDIDKNLLENSVYRIRPLAADFLLGRKNSLDVYSYCGSVTKLDERISCYDGVSMVEIIEHLQKDVLDAAIKMVFSELQPRIVVMTTPNSDFNVLFPELKGFRHWDHKFEWSRKQFQMWCEDITAMYCYTVNFYGIGKSVDRVDVGCCSQSAVFSRQLPRTDLVNVPQTYELVAKSTFPKRERRVDNRKEYLMNEVLFYLNQFRMSRTTDDDVMKVPLADLLTCRKIKEMGCTFSELNSLLISNGYNLTTDENSVIISLETDSSDSDLTVSGEEDDIDADFIMNNAEIKSCLSN